MDEGDEETYVWRHFWPIAGHEDDEDVSKNRTALTSKRTRRDTRKNAELEDEHDEEDDDEDYFPEDEIEEEEEEEDCEDEELTEDFETSETFEESISKKHDDDERTGSQLSYEEEDVSIEAFSREELPVLRARPSLKLDDLSRPSLESVRELTDSTEYDDYRQVHDSMKFSDDIHTSIATRTRRHLDLSKMTIDDLETVLELAPPEVVLQDHDEEYLSFLTSLRDGHSLPLHEEEDEDDDDDYVYEPLEHLSDEFRYDTSVQIPSGELQELLKEACHESYFKEIFERSHHHHHHREIDFARKSHERTRDIKSSLSCLYPFNEEIMSELEHQFKNHVQLLLQTYALGSLLDGETQAVRAALFFLDDLHTKKREWKETSSRSHVSSSSIRTLKSPFDLDCLDVILSLHQLGTLEPEFHREHVKWTRPKLFSPSPVFYQCLNLMKEDRDDSLIVPIHVESNFRIRFTQTEKELLYWGTLKFGIGNWQTIQRELLPGKTSLQVKTLYKNLQSSRVPDNPMKELSRYLRQPLNEREKNILRDAVDHYGPQFDSISMFFLPHRTPTALRRAWYELSKDEAFQMNPATTTAASSESDLLPRNSSNEKLESPTTFSSLSQEQHPIVHSETYDSKDSTSPPRSSSQLTRQETLILSPQTTSGLVSPTKHPHSPHHSSSFFPIQFTPSPKKNASTTHTIHAIKTCHPYPVSNDTSSLIVASSQSHKKLNDLKLHPTSTLSTSMLSFSTTTNASSSSLAINESMDSPPLVSLNHHHSITSCSMNNLSLLLEDSAISLSLSPLKETSPLFSTTHLRETSSRDTSSVTSARSSFTPPPSTIISLPQNHLTIDQGVTYVHFSREEDRQILLIARSHPNPIDVWSSLIASGGTFTSDKSLEHISARYRQLSSWMSLGSSNS